MVQNRGKMVHNLPLNAGVPYNLNSLGNFYTALICKIILRQLSPCHLTLDQANYKTQYKKLRL